MTRTWWHTPFLNALTSACIIVAAIPSLARDAITSFESDIDIHTDGTLAIVETIAVRVDGDTITHGIWRAFPDRSAGGVPFRFAIKDSQRDGVAEPYRIHENHPGTRVYFGRSDNVVGHGAHTYRAVYEVSSPFLSKKGGYTSVWDVTGTDWAFAIDTASATIEIPRAWSSHADIQARAGTSTKGRPCTVQWLTPKTALITSEGPLRPGEGLFVTVNVAGTAVEGLQAGGGTAHADGSAWAFHGPLRRNTSASWFIAAAALSAAGLYFLAVWLIFGIDRLDSPTRFTLTPPDGLSPAAVRTLWVYGYDNVCLAATIARLMVQRQCMLDATDETVVLHTLEAKGTPYEAEERLVATALKLDRPDGTVEFSARHGARVSTAHAALMEHLSRNVATRYLRLNRRPWWVGVLASVAAIAIYCFGTYGREADRWDATMISSIGFIVLTVVGFLALEMIGGIRRALRRRGWLLIVVFSAIVVGLATLAIVLLVLLHAMFGGPMTCISTGLTCLVLTFRFLLRAPTPAGRRILGQVRSLRRGIEHELAQKRPMNRGTWLAVLPYALALDMEPHWTKRYLSQARGPGDRDRVADAIGDFPVEPRDTLATFSLESILCGAIVKAGAAVDTGYAPGGPLTEIRPVQPYIRAFGTGGFYGGIGRGGLGGGGFGGGGFGGGGGRGGGGGW